MGVEHRHYYFLKSKCVFGEMCVIYLYFAGKTFFVVIMYT